LVDESSARLAPYVDFRLLSPERPFIDRLSRNTRHQLRRSNRHYSGGGKLVLHRAETVATGLEYLSNLIRLHDLTWRARGKPGAFATAAVRRFYQALIATGVPNGEVDMLQVTADSAVVGYLMNFRHRGVVSAYQSGFNYAGADQQQKPGLTCHFLAIEAYRAQGAVIYDFLAGADRYKLSLANAQRWLHWLNVAPHWHPRSVSTRLRRMVKL
jgi:CelD/BcsL family acetyltransferase involved in cellulose biosynthesis